MQQSSSREHVDIDQLKPSQWYINRELSWLEFNDRVLREGRRPDTPLLERIKFLAIVASNLDEFFMVRVGGLSQAVRADNRSKDPAGMTPLAQLRAVAARVRRLLKEHAGAVEQALRLLADEGMTFVRREEWTAEQQRFLEQYFREEILPVLTPLGLGRHDNRSLLQALRLYAAVRLERENPSPSRVEATLFDQQTAKLLERLDNDDEAGAADEVHQHDEVAPGQRIAVIPVPEILKRVISIPCDRGVSLTLLEEVMQAFAGNLFPGHRVVSSTVFRITRDSDVAVDEDETADLLQNIETALSERSRRHVVRFEIAPGADPEIRKFLLDYLGVGDPQVFEVPGLLDARVLSVLSTFSGFSHLKYEDWPPQPVADLRESEDIFETLRERDVMISLPYEQFDPVIHLVQRAATDPQTLAIRMVLYRTTSDSPIIAALLEAAKRGKQVTVLVELKARFDEARNVTWARKLEEAGCDVIYGIAGYKTHAKVLLVLRREEHGIRRYAHLATGNYNDKTARLYSDVAIMTADEQLTADVVAFTNLLTGFSQPVGWNRLSISPFGIRRTLEQLIEREIQLTTPRQPGRIIAKMNSLQCPRMIRSLYRASQAGVQVELNIRGICCLRPGIPGLSENIRVTSIIDRFLEHSRIFYFQGGGREDVFLASADWMVRNLDKRLETMFPVADPRLKRRLIEMLDIYMADNRKSWELQAGGAYRPVPAEDTPIRAQELLYHQAVAANQSPPQEQMQFRPRRKQRDDH